MCGACSEPDPRWQKNQNEPKYPHFQSNIVDCRKKQSQIKAISWAPGFPGPSVLGALRSWVFLMAFYETNPNSNSLVPWAISSWGLGFLESCVLGHLSKTKPILTISSHITAANRKSVYHVSGNLKTIGFSSLSFFDKLLKPV
jgi:hypothetical protein